MIGSKKYKRIMRVCISILMVLTLFITAVSADSGPKPSAVITFSNLPETKCIATLLGNTQSIGPWYVEREYIPSGEENGVSREIFQKFKDYEIEGWYFLGFLSDISLSHELSWTYYPPEKFRVLIYMPQEDSWLLSGECSRYAFDSYFAAEVDGSSLSVTVTPNNAAWIKAFLIRLAITIVVELIIALFFGLRSKRQILVITIVNLITQIVLNLLLSTRYASGSWGILLVYIPGEILIFAAEALAYTRLLRDEDHKTGSLVLYAFLANLVTFLIGLALPSLVHFL